MLVYPNKPKAVGLRHPNGAVLKREGADWPSDGFTFRLLTEGAITETAPPIPAGPAPAGGGEK